MNRRIPVLAICVATFLFAAGCSKTGDSPTPDETPHPLPAREPLSTPAYPAPQLHEHERVAPKEGETPAPKPMPGQATGQ